MSKRGEKRQRLYEDCLRLIQGGQWRIGQKVPSLRSMCQAWGVSLTTVQAVYDRLLFESWLTVRERSGYVLTDWRWRGFPNALHAGKAGEETEEKFCTSKETTEERTKEREEGVGRKKTERTAEAEGRNQPVCVSLSSSKLDVRLLQMADWKKGLNRTLREQEQRFLHYGDWQGEEELRWLLSSYLAETRNVFCQPDQVYIGAGIQALLQLVAGFLQQENSRIYFAPPTFRQASLLFECAGYSCLSSLDWLRETKEGRFLAEKQGGSGSRLLFLESQSKGLKGEGALSHPEAEFLTQCLQEGRLQYVLEDDFAGELKYHGRAQAAFFHHCPEKTFYMGSFSRSLLPSVRLGFLVVPKGLNAAFQAFWAGGCNCSASLLEQLTLAHLIAEGGFLRRLARMRREYGERCRWLEAQLAQWQQHSQWPQASFRLREFQLAFEVEFCSPYSAACWTSWLQQRGLELSCQEEGLEAAGDFQAGQRRCGYRLQWLLSFSEFSVEEMSQYVPLLLDVWEECRTEG